MKLLVFSDVHASVEALERVARLAKRKKPDLIVCAGDWTIFGDSMEEMLFLMNELPQKVLLIDGNHEDPKEVGAAVKQFDNLIFKHRAIYHEGDIVFVCYGGGGFSRTDSDFVTWSDKEMKKIKGEKVILLTHAPPANTKLDVLWSGTHCGNKDYTTFIKKYKPKAVLCGHVHESINNYVSKGIRYVNPGPYGEIIVV